MELKTTIERDNVYSHRAKKNIDKKHDRILGELFFSLAKAKDDGIATDHSPSNSVCRTLDIYQVQQLINSHCNKLYTHKEITAALYDLSEPKLVEPSIIANNSELDGRSIGAVRLRYSNPDAMLQDDDTDQIAKELAQVDLTERDTEEDSCNQALELWQQHLLKMHRAQQEDDKLTELYTCDPRPWKNKTFELQEQLECERAMNDSLRNVIIEMAETLHVADPNARISMTSSDLLDLIHSQQDMPNNPF